MIPVRTTPKGFFNEWKLDDGRVIVLLTPEKFAQLVDGTVVISIMGENKTKGRDHIDQDTRCGYLAWGVLRERWPRRKPPMPANGPARHQRKAYRGDRTPTKPPPPFTPTPMAVQYADFLRRKATERAAVALKMHGAYRVEAPRSETGYHWCYKNALNVVVILGGTAEVAWAAYRRAFPKLPL